MDILSSKLRIGDRVEVRTICFQGTGMITDISSSYDRGHGTKLYPSFHIDFDDGLDEWFNGCVLFKVKD